MHRRFPGVSVSELEHRIARFGRVLGRVEGLRVTRLAPHVFRIVRAA